MTRMVEALGLLAVLFLAFCAFGTDMSHPSLVDAQGVPREEVLSSARIRFLALGDVNLGREVGKRILQGDTLFPFARVQDVFSAHDIVFANLECTLSEQEGETQHPRNNLIFTGPPAGARTLHLAGVTVVSTANNHALDYGLKAHAETMEYLKSAGVLFAGTAPDSTLLYDPVILTCKGVKLALFACTDVMNVEDTKWRRYVSGADTSRLLPRVRAFRDSVDFIIVSYHGGGEYGARPTQRTTDFTRHMIEGGADLVLGHHPHVPYGVAHMDGKYGVHSLGNFVFRQPSRYWTQRSFAFSAEIMKDKAGTRISSYECLPVMCGLQPEFITPGPESDIISERIRAFSTTIVASK